MAAVMTGHEELASEPFGVQWHATHLGELSMLTVGNPLSLYDKVTTLTDTSQGGYRRMAIVDDRLIGYLSLGTRQPDSLAIKRIIDEGHSVRAITKALLRGTFDARKYLSQQHILNAHGMLTTKALPSLPTGNADAQRPPMRIPGSAQSGPTRVLPSPLEPAIVQTDPLRAVERNTDGLRSYPLPLREAEPITGSQRIPDAVEEELSPFTGHLPSTYGVVESTLVREGYVPSGKLWSYAPETQPGRETFTAPQPPHETKRQHSGKLWTYGNNEQQKKGR